MYVCIYLFILHLRMFIDFRERKRGKGRETERERNICVREKYGLAAFGMCSNWVKNPSMCPDQRPNP